MTAYMLGINKLKTVPSTFNNLKSKIGQLYIDNLEIDPAALWCSGYYYCTT